ncbi:MAG: tetratricopeptide repeat protein [Thermodesulfobacteriota bacterium]|nr:tetratricopeptide repeat protein [Thermodesulfobacteriota bacterium]
MSSIKRGTFFIACVLCVFMVISAFIVYGSSGTEGYDLFFQANQDYKEGAYEKAATAYEELIQDRVVGGAVYYNLGNCYFRMNRLGKAILNYERSRYLMPRDPDLDFNLRHSKEMTKDKIEESSSFPLFQWIDYFSLAEVFWVFVILNILFWAVLLMRLWINSEWGFYMVICLGIVWVIIGVSSTMKWYRETHDKRAVIITPQMDVHSGPDERETVLFKLHEGAMVMHEREEEDWALIFLSSEKRGWAKAGSVERIIICGE